MRASFLPEIYLSSIHTPRTAPAAAAVAAPAAHAAGAAPAVPTADDGGTSGDIRIPAFALDVDLSGLAVIRIESVRRVARFLNP